MNQNKNEREIRPLSLDDFIGQEQLVNNLRIFISSAKKRNQVLDHILLYGPPGVGKTTIAKIIANETGTNYHEIPGPSIEKVGDIFSCLSDLQVGDILFIDEIHRIPKELEETLYSIMEDYRISIVVNREAKSRVFEMEIPPFTLIGATTKQGYLSMPFLSRFGYQCCLKYYTTNELIQIINRAIEIYEFKIDFISAKEIAKRSKGTPRICLNYLRRVIDYASFYNTKNINIRITEETFINLKVDCLGLTEIECNYLNCLYKTFQNVPVGLKTISDTLNEDITTIENICEPYLLYLGFIIKTPKGRQITEKAIAHIEKISKI